jgi:hypothetical protein
MPSPARLAPVRERRQDGLHLRYLFLAMRSRQNRNWLQVQNVRCIDGRAMRHDPQPDDPYLETDIGQCEECRGHGCENQLFALKTDYIDDKP